MNREPSTSVLSTWPNAQPLTEQNEVLGGGRFEHRRNYKFCSAIFKMPHFPVQNHSLLMNNPPEQQYRLFQSNLSWLFSPSSYITIFSTSKKYTALISLSVISCLPHIKPMKGISTTSGKKCSRLQENLTAQFLNEFYKPLPCCLVTKNNLKENSTLMCKSLLSEHISYNPVIYMSSCDRFCSTMTFLALSELYERLSLMFHYTRKKYF